MNTRWDNAGFTLMGLLLIVVLLIILMSMLSPFGQPVRFPTERVDEVLGKLEWGNVVFTSPDLVALGEEVLVRLMLSPSKSVEQLESEMASLMPVNSEEVRISDVMEAELEGVAFDITALDEGPQAVSNQETTFWEWTVVAKQGGKQTLRLRLFAIILLKGERVPRKVGVYNYPIRVEVTVGQWVAAFIGTYWTYLLATIIIPAGLFLAGRYRAWARARAEREQRDRELFNRP